MFPIAFTVVEAETKDSWEWFVELLLNDLNRIKPRKWSFISDQHKVWIVLLNLLIVLLFISQFDHHFTHFRVWFPHCMHCMRMWSIGFVSNMYMGIGERNTQEKR